MNEDATQGRMAPGPDAQPATLLRRSAILQRDAQAVLRDLALVPILSRFGRVIPTGSSVYGLMVARDIDVYVVREHWTPAMCWAALADAFPGDGLQSIRLSKWLGRHRAAALPEGFSAVLRYYTASREQWRIDVWFFTPDQAEANLVWHRELAGDLEPEVRLAILWLKDVGHAAPSYSSARVYDAVVHHGVRSLTDFERYLADAANGGPAESEA